MSEKIKLTPEQQRAKTFNNKVWFHYFGIEFKDVLDIYESMAHTQNYNNPLYINESQIIETQHNYHKLNAFYTTWIDVEKNGEDSIFNYLTNKEMFPEYEKMFLKGIMNKFLRKLLTKTANRYTTQEWISRMHTIKDNVIKLYEKHEERTDGRN